MLAAAYFRASPQPGAGGPGAASRAKGLVERSGRLAKPFPNRQLSQPAEPARSAAEGVGATVQPSGRNREPCKCTSRWHPPSRRHRYRRLTGIWPDENKKPSLTPRTLASIGEVVHAVEVACLVWRGHRGRPQPHMGDDSLAESRSSSQRIREGLTDNVGPLAQDLRNVRVTFQSKPLARNIQPVDHVIGI